MKFKYQLILLLLTTQTIFAQESIKSNHPEATNCDERGYCWGDKREEGKVKFAMYSDNYNFGDYAWKDAELPLDWLLNNIPYLTFSMYVNGYKIYDFLEEGAEGDKKIEYQDKLLNLLDNRIAYFGDEADVLQRKGVKAYPYLIKREDKDYDSLFELYKKIFELNGADTYRGNMTYLIVMAKIQYSRKKIDADTFIDYLEKVGLAIDEAKTESDEKEKEKWLKTEEQIESLIPDDIFNCEFITERMGPKLKAEPENLDHAKKVMKFLVKGKCYDTPIFLETAKAVFNGEPTASMASVIAKKYLVSKDFDSTLIWFDKGIEVAGEETAKKAEFYLEKAQILNAKGRLGEAREAAINAVELDKSNTGQAYILIGDMYMLSGNRCENNNPVKYRAIYLAAYDAYAIAGAAAKMNNAKEQFPSIEEIFTAGLEEGEKIEVGCWIGGQTELRRRP
jgi:hypothetical protein